MPTHKILGDKVNVYRRENSRYWQCSTYLAGRNHRVSSKEESLSRAKEFAEDWYLGLRGKFRDGELKSEKTFKDAAQRFLAEYEILTNGERSPKYVEGHKIRLRVHLLPFFGRMGVSEVTTGVVQDYRIARTQGENGYKPPARSTLHHEIVTLRQVLKSATRQGWLQQVPDISQPYAASSKVSHRAWFSPEEYRQLYTETRRRAREAEEANASWKWAAAQLHDKILFMANTGLRPDEANWLEYRDVTIVDDEASGETILEIEVRGKRGVGYCKSTAGAVRPFQRMIDRNEPDSTDRIFPTDHKKQFNRVLEAADLKFDRQGNRRTLKG